MISNYHGIFFVVYQILQIQSIFIAIDVISNINGDMLNIKAYARKYY